jgi:hypothetical protein
MPHPLPPPFRTVFSFDSGWKPKDKVAMMVAV